MTREGFPKAKAFKQTMKGENEPAKGRAGRGRLMQSLEGKENLDMCFSTGGNSVPPVSGIILVVKTIVAIL